MKNDKVLTAVFCGFIGIFALLFFVTPKAETSVNEKRTLEKFPDASVKSVFSGSFESKFENYLNDHFPFRDSLVALDSYYALYTGRNGANGVYKCKDGFLINTPVSFDSGAFETNLAALNDFAESTNIPTQIMAIPTAGYMLSDKLPKNHDVYSDGEILSRAKEILTNIEWYDMESVLKSDAESMYYKTDHHWTMNGAYRAYLEYAERHDMEPLTDFEKETYDGFYGTSYSKSALWGEKSESLEVWRYPNNVTVEISDGAGVEVYDDMFFEEHLSEPDMYPVFLDGNHAIERLTNPDSDGGRLLVLKDSYAHCLVPLLINHYSSIDMIDLRYYLDSVSELVAERDYDEILMVYGLSSLCESRDISILQ